MAASADVLPAPPGPETAVTIAEIRADPLGFLRELTERYGDIVRHETEEQVVITLNRAEFAHHVLRNRDRNYAKRGTPDDAMLTPLLGRGLLTSEGEVWKKQRRITQPAFEKRRIDGFGELIVEETLALVERWRERAGQVVRLDHELSSLTLAVVARAILGSEMTGIGGRFGEAIDTVNRFMGHYDPMLPGAEGARARAEFGNALNFLDGLVALLVQARRAGGEDGDDLLSALLTGGFDDREIRDQVLTMLMAGHETTAKTLSWTSFLLDGHPEVAARLDAELDSVLDGREIQADDLARLPLLAGVINEALRLYPPVWLISRTAIVDDEIGGYAVPAGALVCISPYLLHRHPDYWDEPETFDPDRFAGEPLEGRPEFAFMPFSGGPRRCIGERFALFEAQLALATIRQKVEIRLVADHPVEPEALVTLRPRHGLLATVALR
jgi:enediyne biosynthesis protein E7